MSERRESQAAAMTEGAGDGTSEPHGAAESKGQSP